MVSGRPILTVSDDVDALRCVFGEDNVARLTCENQLPSRVRLRSVQSSAGLAVRPSSVVASVAKEVLVYRLDSGFRRLAG